MGFECMLHTVTADEDTSKAKLDMVALQEKLSDAQQQRQVLSKNRRDSTATHLDRGPVCED